MSQGNNVNLARKTMINMERWAATRRGYRILEQARAF